MTQEISNKTLAFLLVGAIVVSLFGTFISLNRLDNIGPSGLRQITGMYTDSTTGTVQLNVQGDIAFSVVNSVNFGDVTPITGTLMNITTDNINAQGQGNDCTTGANCMALEIQNDGNEVINLTFNVSTNAAGLIGGSAPAAPGFYFYARNGNRTGVAASPGCTGNMSYGRNNLGLGAGTNWQSISTGANYSICVTNNTLAFTNGLNFTSGFDMVSIEFNLTIPADAVQGAKTATITIFNEPDAT